MRRSRTRSACSWLAAFLSGLSLVTTACVGTGKTALASAVARGPLDVESLPEAVNPRAMSELDYGELEPGKTWKSRFENDDPQLVVDDDASRFKAFLLPVDDLPLKIHVETATSFEVPHYPVKYLFCPKILLLDAAFGIVHSSVFEDLEKKQRIFGEPRFVLDYTLWPDSPKARYLIVVRERAFDGRYVSSMYEDKSGQYDSALRKKRERIYSSLTGPVHVTVKRVDR